MKRPNFHRRYTLDELRDMLHPKMIECNIGEAYFYNIQRPDRKGRPASMNIYYTLNRGASIEDSLRFEGWLWETTHHRVSGYCTDWHPERMDWARKSGIPVF